MYKKLREARKKKGITPRCLADVIGLKTEAAYYKKESGRIKFSLEEAKLIADALDENVDAIFFDNKVSKTETKKDCIGGEKMDKKMDSIVNEIYELMKAKEITFAEAQQVISRLRNKLYASAKIN